MSGHLFRAFVGLNGPQEPGRVVGEIRARQRVATLEDRLDDAPTRFDHVCALEERGIASHTIAQEALVASAVLRAE